MKLRGLVVFGYIKIVFEEYKYSIVIIVIFVFLEGVSCFVFYRFIGEYFLRCLCL